MSLVPPGEEGGVAVDEVSEHRLNPEGPVLEADLEIEDALGELGGEQHDPERDERENGRPDLNDADEEEVRDADVDHPEQGPQDQLAARVLFLMCDRQLHVFLLWG